MSDGRIITLFGSAAPQEGDEEYMAAWELGRLLASAGYVLCNGGYGGIMEASARGARERGGHTIGVIISSVSTAVNPFIVEVIPRHSLLERLETLLEKGDGYIVLPGGTGTLLELAAVWEYLNKSLMPQKPVIVLGSFWQPVVETLTPRLRSEGSPGASAIGMARTARECMAVLSEKLVP